MSASVTIMLMTNGVLFEEHIVVDEVSSEDALTVFNRLKNMVGKNQLALKSGTASCETCKICDKCDKDCCSDCTPEYCNCEGHVCGA